MVLIATNTVGEEIRRRTGAKSQATTPARGWAEKNAENEQAAARQSWHSRKFHARGAGLHTGTCMSATFDAIVIGAGQAGPALVGRLAASGMTVAVIERHLFGGTCVNTGCTPTKTLVASAEVAHQARRAAEYGVSIDGGCIRRYARREGTQRHDCRHFPRRDRDMAREYEGLHGLQRACALRVGARSACRRRRAARETDFHQCRGSAPYPDMPGVGSVPILNQHLDSRAGNSPAAPAGRRRQLYRARVRARCFGASAAPSR